jgi:sn-glycerol 3-phosphate transport system substrate-binding protein
MSTMKTSRRLLALTAVASMAVAACGGDDGGSLSNAGNDATTLAPGETSAPGTTVAASLADLPPCPVDALDEATSPVEITFWHGMTGELEKELTRLTKQYNDSQSKVRVKLQNQGGYEQTLDKYLQSSQNSRPAMVQAPEYALQVLADSESFVPMAACVEAGGYDISSLLPAAVNAYSTEGVQWSMPFNMSNPVLYYDKTDFVKAGLDPAAPPRSLEELRAASQAIVDSGAASFGLAVDTNFDSGGGWFIEQWFAKAGEFYSDNDNGRSAPATQVLFDSAAGVELMTFLQQLEDDGLAVNVGDNTSGQDTFLKIADPTAPASMTIGTSAAIGSVLAALEAGLAPGLTREDLGIGTMPGPDGSTTVLVGGASLWIVADKGDAQAAAAWDYVQFLLSAEVQSEWAAATGYVPVNQEAVDAEPLATTYSDDPRFAVAYESILSTPADEPTAVGPLLGPQREIRVLTSRALATIFGGGDVQEALTKAKAEADVLLANYNARN